MNDVMICLVGEQPIPNLLPIRYDVPTHAVLAYTEDVREVAKRLEKALRGNIQVYPLQVLPFDIPAIRKQLEEFITHRGWDPSQMVFNLTGGTKAMAFAGYSLAVAWGSRFLYLQSREVLSRVYRYDFRNGMPILQRDEVIPGVITIDDYLRVHLGAYQMKGRFDQVKGGKFEELIYSILKSAGLEVVAGVQYGGVLDIDLVVRYENQVGIIQAKTGNAAKKLEGINHLNTAGKQDFLGTYTKKLLIVGIAWDHTVSHNRSIAEASDIKVIELPSYEQTGNLSDLDRDRLIREVREILGG
jgi:hypothetical protein